MSIATIILGESGSGKTAALRNMKPDETLLIQVVRKPLPFKMAGWKRQENGEAGNIFVTDNWSKMIEIVTRTKRKVIVVDDFQYLMANEFMRRSDETGFAKFTEIGRHAFDVLNVCNNLPDDVRVYILSHTNTDDNGTTRMKTIGKMLDEKITLEGLFSIVLRSNVEGGTFSLTTVNNGHDTVKSPMGLFDSEKIENDLALVDKAICDYYNVTPTTWR